MEITIKIIIIATIFILLITFVSIKISGFDSSNSNYFFNYSYNHSWTKAICNETACQDYEIYCNGDKFVKKIPITGAVIDIPNGWVDPRNETMRERICNFN